MLKHLLAPMAVLALSACGSGEKSTTIVGVIRSESDGTTRHMVNMQSTDSIGKVAAFYKDGFVRAGLKTTSEMMTADGGMMSAEGGGRKVSIAISQDEGKTAAIVTYSGD